MLIDIGPDRAIEFPGKRDPETGRYVAVGGSVEPPAGSLSFGTTTLGGTYTELENGGEITIKTDTYDFGPGPNKFIALGFGEGWLYEGNLGEKMPEFVTDPLSGETFEYERGGGTSNGTREIAEESGVRYLTAFVQGDETGSNDGSLGMINWDLGREVAEQEPVFMSSWYRPNAGATSLSDSTQLKTFRLRQLKNLDGDGINMVYSSSFPDIPNDPGNLRYPLTAGDSMTSGARQWIGEGWQREDLLIIPNNRDQENGYLLSQGWHPDKGGVQQEFPADNFGRTGDGTARLYDADPALPGWIWLMVQDFINGHDGEGRTDRMDMYWAVGTLARFEIADGPTPDLSSRSHILPEKDRASSQEVTCHIWKGLAPSFAGMYLHAYGHDGQFIDSVEIE